MGRFALAVHGGAGLIRRDSLPPERERDCRATLREAIDAGSRVLEDGGSALEACIAAVCVLEDSPLFNAGRGGVFAADGQVWMDAAVMDGADRSAGAVASVRTLRNPVRAADLVRRCSGHVLMVGPEAEAFAAAHGAAVEDPAWFFVQERWEHFQRARAAGKVALDHELDDVQAPKGTVGAVALDVHGHVAAATSTGGLANKLPGRVGDSPVIGAGTYAWDRTCAVSATGVGEAFIRGCAAARVSAWMDIGGLDLETAAARVIFDELPEVGGTGGLIAVDRSGRLALPFNSGGMYRAFRDTEGRVAVDIW